MGTVTLLREAGHGFAGPAMLAVALVLAGLSVLGCHGAEGPSLANPVRLAKDGFFRLPDGELYLPLGGLHGNVIPVTALTLTPEQTQALQGKLWQRRFVDFADATEDMLDQWFRQCQANGVNSLRLFPRANVGVDVLDLCGKVNPELQADFHRAFTVGAKYNIRFLLQIMPEPGRTGYEAEGALRQFVLPRYSKEEMEALSPAQKRFLVDRKIVGRREFFTDPDVLSCQKLYLQRVLKWLATEPQVFALEIYNEQAWWYSTRTAEGRNDRVFTFPFEDEEIRWTAELVKTIHEELPGMPVCLSHPGFGVAAYDPIKWSRATKVDFYSTHMYSGLCGDVADTDFAAVTGATAKVIEAGGIINFTGEWGILDRTVPQDLLRRGYRDGIWLGLLARSPGFMQWEHAPMEEYRWPSKVWQSLPKGFSPAPSGVAVEIGQAYADYQDNSRYPMFKADPPPGAFAFVKERFLDKNLQDIYAAYRRGLELGVPVRFTMGDKGAMSMERFAVADAASLAHPVTAVGGYQLAYVKDSHSPTWLGYLRSRKVQKVGGQALGVPVESPLTLKLDLPKGRYTVRLINLDKNTTTRHEVDGKSDIIVAEKSSDDYVVLITRSNVKLPLDEPGVEKQ